MSEQYQPTHIVIRASNFLFSGYSAFLGILTPGLFVWGDSGLTDLVAHFSAWILMMVGFWLNATHAPNLNYFSASSAAVVMIGGTFQIFTLPLVLGLSVYLGLGVLSYFLKSSHKAKLDVLSVIYSFGIGIFLMFSSITYYF